MVQRVISGKEMDSLGNNLSGKYEDLVEELRIMGFSVVCTDLNGWDVRYDIVEMTNEKKAYSIVAPNRAQASSRLKAWIRGYQYANIEWRI